MQLWSAVLFVVYACVFLVLRSYASDAAGYLNTTVQVILDSTAFVQCIYYFRKKDLASGRLRLPLLLLGSASALMALVDFTWGVSVNIRGLDEQAISFAFNRVPYTCVLLLWVVFWTLLIQIGSDRLTAPLVSSTLVSWLGLLLVFIAYVRYSLHGPTPEASQVFVYLFIGLELIGLLLCVASSAALSVFPGGIAVAYISFACADLFINASELSGKIPQNSFAELVWTFAEFSLICGIPRFLPKFATMLETQPRGPAASNQKDARPLISPLLVSTAFGLLVAVLVFKDRLQLAALLVLITGATIVLNLFSRRLGEGVAEAFDRLITYRPLEEISIQTRRSLSFLGIWDSFQAYKKQITSGVLLPLGRDFPFDAAVAWEKPREDLVFVCMPFSTTWSAAVRQVIQESVEKVGWSSIRADEVYDRADVLDEIWALTCKARAVIADVTGHNANVLYELGIAHALGKPLILLCQHGTGLPFDLSTKRTLFYRVQDGVIEQLGAQLERQLSALQKN